MMIRFLFIIGCFLIGYTEISAQSQNWIRKEYLHGWEMYKTGHYDMAMEILKPLTLPDNESSFTPYAGYYYSLAAFSKGYNYLAEEMLKEILEKYPDWDQADFARLWLVRIYLAEREYGNGIAWAVQIKKNTIKDRADDLVKNEFAVMDSLERVISFYEEYPEYKALGEVIADRIVLEPIMNQDRELLGEIVRKFNLDRDQYDIIDDIASVKKDVYHVAVLFPFMLHDIVPNKVRRGNDFILDMYEGMKLAKDDLARKGIKLNLYAFDTRMDSTVTRKLVRSGQLDGMDLIIGPLYPDPVKIISEFSFNNRINMFNPLSTNSSLISNNPFSFLMKPSTERQALVAGDYVAHQIFNPHGMIFYEKSERDSLMAHTFKNKIEQDSFDIVLMKKMTPSPDSVNVYDLLMNKVNIDQLALTAEDSQRIIKKYHLESYLEEYQMKNRMGENGRPLEILSIAPDSIGHIFVASNNELIGANTISGVETRRDNIMIIGNENWLDFKSLSLEQLAMLNIVLIAPSYVERDNSTLNEINSRIIDAVNKLPNKYHYTGYELLRFVGEMLGEYGVYFQTGMSKMGKFPGVIYEGFDYSQGNDNAVVPLIKFEKSEFRIVN
ncbi:MAG: amino acid ABC transporter substrate-binding protein [Cyclobacteriaceae bacterium]|nr:amino acid ABC transporter substrate-binding protein [Cyclobacteriaceae bacterium]